MIPFRMNPAGQADTITVPTGLPSGTLMQTGSSITPQFLAVVLGGVVVVGALAYVLTRSAPASNDETRARAAARASARSMARRGRSSRTYRSAYSGVRRNPASRDDVKHVVIAHGYGPGMRRTDDYYVRIGHNFRSLVESDPAVKKLLGTPFAYSDEAHDAAQRVFRHATVSVT